MLGSFMGGYLYDLFAQYDWVWIVSVGLALIAACLTMLIRENREGNTTQRAELSIVK